MERETNGETSPVQWGSDLARRKLPVLALSAATGSVLTETLLSSLTGSLTSDDEGKSRKIELLLTTWQCSVTTKVTVGLQTGWRERSSTHLVGVKVLTN